ncbi:MAG TPA: histidine kinase dimerization/phospho-acceptor domain-containing protein, partial [Prolixibacteraceae bacterium]|nr:histidine kinase dimerization/phospho-acceptor domain-containing protein [Prolixibacteraceae bacterium]
MKSPQTLLGILSVLVLAGGIVFFLFKHRKHTYTRFKELIKTVGALKKQLNQQTEKLEIALVKAEEANRLKSLFLANMSHEIRTPLNGIVGFSELMADEGFNLEQKREFACQIEQNSRHLLQIMDQIFHLSIIETGNVKIYREPFPIQSFLSSVSRQFKNKVEHSGKAIRFVLTRPEENLQVITDKQKLHLIIENLLDNALKFTDRGSIELGFIK